MHVYAKANPDRLRKAVDTLGRAVSEAERAENSRTGVKREVLPLAAGGENQSYPPVGPRGYAPRGRKAGGWARTNDLPLTRRLLCR